MPAEQTSGLVEKIAEIAERTASGTDIEIADVQLRGAGKARLLRVYVDKPGGITHGDCELISERLSKLLDEEDVIPGDSYTLEVSSLGLERPLAKLRDFERVVGHKVGVTVRQPIDGAVRVEGSLVRVSDNLLDIETAPGHTVRVPLEQVQRAKLKFDW